MTHMQKNYSQPQLPLEQGLTPQEKQEIEREYVSDEYDRRLERSWVTGRTKY